MNGQTMILVSDTAILRAQSLVARAPRGSVMVISPPKRTVDQSAKMWAMLSDVSRSKPDGRRHTPDVWKCLFMAAAGYEVQFLMGLDGNPFPAGFRSSRLTKAQMAELITFVQAWGDEHGVVWTEQGDGE